MPEALNMISSIYAKERLENAVGCSFFSNLFTEWNSGATGNVKGIVSAWDDSNRSDCT